METLDQSFFCLRILHLAALMLYGGCVYIVLFSIKLKFTILSYLFVFYCCFYSHVKCTSISVCPWGSVCVYSLPVECFILLFFSLFSFENVSVFGHPIQMLINTNKLPKSIFPFSFWALSPEKKKIQYFKNIFYGVVLRIAVNNIILLGPQSNVFFSTSAYFVNGNT